MKKFPQRIALLCLGWCLAAPGTPPTHIQFWFDTEDYTWNRSNDAIREIATIMTDEGVRGNFNIVGYLAKFIQENQRTDVIKALKPHLIGTQTLYHSRHPNVTEVGDLPDYAAAYRIISCQEFEAAGMLKAVFGLDALALSCFPGNGSSYVALDVYADMGIPVHGGLGAFKDATSKKGKCYYLNQLHLFYNGPVSLESLMPGVKEKIDWDAKLDACAQFEHVILYMHPHMICRKYHWDAVNFNHRNPAHFGQWLKVTPYPEYITQGFYKNFRAFIRRIKNDPRFVFTDSEKVLAAEKPRVPITRKDIPAIRKALLKNFGPVESPASWCVADIFQAAIHFLQDEKMYTPGKVYGFLEKPRGIQNPVVIKADDLRAAARTISFTRHLNASYKVGDVEIGPADFLFAALEVLETNAAEVRLSPREQLGDIAAHFPHLPTFKHTESWIYWPDFKDTYLSDRLRWQFWTLRY